MSEPNACCQEWRDECNRYLGRIADLERQVIAEKERADYAVRNLTITENARQEEMAKRDALTEQVVALEKERDEALNGYAIRDDEVTGFIGMLKESRDQLAAAQAVIAEVHTWVVCACIATPEDMAQNFGRIAEITAPSDDTALQARLAEEREKCAVAAWTHYADVCKRKGLNPHHHGEWIASTAIRSMK